MADIFDIMEGMVRKKKKGTKVPKDGLNLFFIGMPAPPPMKGGGDDFPTRPPDMGGAQPRAFNTGAGPDGVVQPEKPAMFDQSTKSVYHEGETVVPKPYGKEIIPAKTPADQQKLGKMEALGYPGFQTGGTAYVDEGAGASPGGGGAGGATTDTTGRFDLSPDAQRYKTGQASAYQTYTGMAEGRDPVAEQIAQRRMQDYDARAAHTLTAAKGDAASMTDTTEAARRATMAGAQRDISLGRAELAGELSENALKRRDTALGKMWDLGRTGVRDEVADQQWQKTFDEDVRQYGHTEGWNRYNAAVAAGDYETAAAEYKALTGNDLSTEHFERAQSHLYTMWGHEEEGAELDNIAKKRNIDINVLAAAQSMLASGMSLESVNAMFGTNLTEDDATAIKAASPYGMWKTEFGFRQEQYRDDRNWQKYTDALDRYDWDGAKAAYKAMFPDSPEPDMSALRADREHMVDYRDTVLEGMRDKLKESDFDAIQTRIDAGMPYGDGSAFDINGDGEPDITEDEYLSMKDASPLGDRDYDRRMSVVNLLMETGGGANYAKAATMLNETFPGLNIDFTRLVQDENAQSMTTVFGEMGDYVADIGTDWDEVPENLKTNWANTSGMGKKDLELMYTAMNVNSIDEMFDDILNSTHLTDADKDLIIDFQTKNMTGELFFGYRETGKYEVIGEDGETVVGTYDSEDEAKAAAAGIEGATIQAEKTVALKDTTTGELLLPPGASTTTGTANVDAVVETVENWGISADRTRVEQYLAEKGEAPPDAKTFRTWDANTANPIAVEDALASGDMGSLRQVDWQVIRDKLRRNEIDKNIYKVDGNTSLKDYTGSVVDINFPMTHDGRTYRRRTTSKYYVADNNGTMELYNIETGVRLTDIMAQVERDKAVYIDELENAE